jgi:hypothetical protein
LLPSPRRALALEAMIPVRVATKIVERLEVAVDERLI